MADLTKLSFHSAYPAFKNNNTYEGSFTISGTTSGGTNVITTTVNLDTSPDLCDVIFSGRSTQTYTSRPNNAWFKQGVIEARGDNAGAGFVNFPTAFVITSKIDGNQLIITATWVQTFTTVLTLTSTDVSYKIVDYSVF